MKKNLRSISLIMLLAASPTAVIESSTRRPILTPSAATAGRSKPSSADATARTAAGAKVRATAAAKAKSAAAESFSSMFDIGGESSFENQPDTAKPVAPIKPQKTIGIASGTKKATNLNLGESASAPEPSFNLSTSTIDAENLPLAPAAGRTYTQYLGERPGVMLDATRSALGQAGSAISNAPANFQNAANSAYTSTGRVLGNAKIALSNAPINLRSAVNSTGNFLGQAGTAISDAASTAGTTLGQAGTAISSAAGTAYKSAGNALGQAGNAVSSAYTSAGKTVSKFSNDFTKDLNTKVYGDTTIAGAKLFKMTPREYKTIWRQKIDYDTREQIPLTSLEQANYDIKDTRDTIYHAPGSLVRTMGLGDGNILTNTKTAISSAANTAGTALGSAYTSAGNALSSAYTSTGTALGNAYSSAGTALGQAGKALRLSTQKKQNPSISDPDDTFSTSLDNEFDKLKTSVTGPLPTGHIPSPNSRNSTKALSKIVTLDEGQSTPQPLFAELNEPTPTVQAKPAKASPVIMKPPVYSDARAA